MSQRPDAPAASQPRDLRERIAEILDNKAWSLRLRILLEEIVERLDERDRYYEALRLIATGQTGSYGSFEALAKVALDPTLGGRDAA